MIEEITLELGNCGCHGDPLRINEILLITSDVWSLDKNHKS